MIRDKVFGLGASLSLLILLTGFAAAQETTTKTTTTTTTKKEVVRNPDGSYTVIEYPVGKEVTVELMPNNLQGAKGWARVMRTDNGTNIEVDLSGLPSDAKNFYVYAVDPAGKVTLLGPLNIDSGASRASFSTPMNQFMLVLSPNESLTTISTDTPVVFRSAVPTGYAVVPTAVTSVDANRQVAVTTEVASTYQVPLLGVSSFTKTAEMRINFTGDLAGLKAKAYIDPTKDGLTKIKMRFDEMHLAPRDKRFVLWAVSADGKYTKLGQVVNTDRTRKESEIRSETALSDFGLFVTVEDADVAQPTSTIYAPVVIGTP
jgi:hypothetical protein